MTAYGILLRTELRLVLRDFFTVSFALVFPPMMLLLFGNLFGAELGPSGGTMICEMTPAYTCIVMGVTGLLGFPMTLSSNMERGVYRRFDASPVGKLRVIAGELSANLLLTLAGLVILFVFAWAVFGAVPKGSWWAVAGAVVLDSAAIFSMGFFIAAAAPNARAALALCYAAYFVMLFLSGATLPRLLFTDALLAVSDWIPMTYAVQLMQDAFNGVSTEAGRDIGILTATCCGCMAAGGALFRRRL